MIYAAIAVLGVVAFTLALDRWSRRYEARKDEEMRQWLLEREEWRRRLGL